MASIKLLKSLSAQELRRRLAWKCPLKSHRNHNGLEHPRCYEKLVGVNLKEKIGFLDIETEDLNADFGIMFSWCLLDGDTNKIHEDRINLKDIKKNSSHKRNVHPKEDTRIITSLVECMEKYDRVVTHYGSLFDLKFIRTRAVICGVRFPEHGVLYQADTCKILWAKFKLRRNNLGASCRSLVGKSRKDFLSLSIKHGCLRGEEWAIKDSIEHCRKDVLDTRDLYKKIYPYVKTSKTSI